MNVQFWFRHFIHVSHHWHRPIYQLLQQPLRHRSRWHWSCSCWRISHRCHNGRSRILQNRSTRCHFLRQFLVLLGTALQTACNCIGMLIAGGFINGICVGITSSQVLVYLAEIAKKETRGSIVVIRQWAIECGIFIMYFVGYGCKFIQTTATASFRTAWAIQFVPCVILMAGIPFLPRSPR
jgi:MFS family permease